MIERFLFTIGGAIAGAAVTYVKYRWFTKQVGSAKKIAHAVEDKVTNVKDAIKK